jgi:hypothetical protein
MISLPPSLHAFAGEVTRVRCLSDRHGREVLLVEDAAHRLRIFKIHRGLTPPDLVRFEAVRQRLAELPRCDHVLPILAFQADRPTGVAWEELTLAEGVQPGGLEFDRYAPVQLEPGGSPEPEVAVQKTMDVAAGVVAALEYFHGHGLVHGDLKPGNILRLNGRWVLADYDTLGATENVLEITASTEGYQPPGGGTGYDRDTYALGKLLYESWSGRSRLEYPAPPGWAATGRAWGPEDRLLQALLQSLCSPLSGTRLTRLESIREVLEALASGDAARLARAGKILHTRRLRIGWALAALLALAIMAGGLAFSFRRPPAVISARATLDGIPLVYSLAGGPDNNGTIRQTTNGIFTFNAHTTIPRALNAGDRVEIELKKEAWRGHVSLYLTDTLILKRSPGTFYHLDHFGMSDHLMFFHLDGDSLAAPTRVASGAASTLGPPHWTRLGSTNSLAPYRITLEVEAGKASWSIVCEGRELARGWHPLATDHTYLNFYGFDNTTYLLRKIRITKTTNNPASQPQL